jgi:hypothetical protein
MREVVSDADAARRGSPPRAVARAVMFWESFWATMWGALAGAVIGAVAAYWFARDLARRERAQRLADDAARREADEAARYRAVIPMHVTRIVEALHRYADELSQLSPFGFGSRPLGEAPPPPRHTARAQVLAAIDTASVDAQGRDQAVFAAVRDALLNVSRTREGASEVGGLIDLLVAWQIFDADRHDDVIAGLESYTGSLADAHARERPDD